MSLAMYPTDLSDEQWSRIEAFTARPDPRGALSVYPKREIINAILYLNKTGCQWRMLPADFPRWQNVYNHFRRMQERGVWEQMCRELNKGSRKKGGARKRQATC
jgi:putative transposase